MRRVVLACTVIALLAGCQQPADAPADKAAEPAAATAPVMPADAPPQEEAIAPTEASSTSCTLDQGSDAAIALASRCTRVSPASHPPCNPDNPCQVIQDEIDRSCALWTREGNVPPECAA